MLLADLPGVPSGNHRLSKLSINASDRWHHNSTEEQDAIDTEELTNPWESLSMVGARCGREKRKRFGPSQGRKEEGRKGGKKEGGKGFPLVPIVPIIGRAIGSLLV